MAKFVTNLDLNFNELQNAVLNPVAEDPATLKEGMVWYNTTAKEFRCYKDGEVKPLGAQAQFTQANSVDELPAVAQQGDMGVVISAIDGADGTKKSYTAYVYDEGVWKAMDGNYDAGNVYFGEDLTYTVAIGTLAKPNGSGTLQAKGKSVKEVLASILAKEANPSKTEPSVSFTTSNGLGTYEIGTKKNLTYAVSLSADEYTYGPATGITAQSWSVVCDGVPKTTVNGTSRMLLLKLLRRRWLLLLLMATARFLLPILVMSILLGRLLLVASPRSLVATSVSAICSGAR